MFPVLNIIKTSFTECAMNRGFSEIDVMSYSLVFWKIVHLLRIPVSVIKWTMFFQKNGVMTHTFDNTPIERMHHVFLKTSFTFFADQLISGICLLI